MGITAEQIDAMPAGSALDQLVAEALGWTFVPELSAWVEGLGPLPSPAVYVDQQGVERLRSEFRPSRNWDAAMVAAEKLLPQPWLLLHEGNHWNVRQKLSGVRDIQANEAHYRVAPLASSMSGPLSICRAILKVKLP